MHPERRRRTAQLAQLAADHRWETLFQRLMLEEFPSAARMGWQLAFLRPFAVPRMARTLVRAGQLVDNPRKRAYDTGLIIYEIVHGGLDSPRARAMVSLINRAHHGRAIGGDDMIYVLCAFIVTPIRHIEWVGWRALTAEEKHSAVEFFGRLGRMMNIEVVPATYPEAEQLYDDFESRNTAPSPEGRVLGSNLVRVLKDMQPAAARPLATPIFTLLLRDRRVVEAIGLQPPSALLQWAIVRAARLRAAWQRTTPPSTKPIFTPGKPVRAIYPHGYELKELGPQEADAS